MDRYSNTEEGVLEQLREEFEGHRIWRSVRADGRLGEWVASLHDPKAGITPTLMHPTPEALRTALVQERARAEGRNL
ncbi:hypothetical protein GCM10010191_67410 [Actinomadura vinacea]|uniref:Uncharacterized protein n=1 Tax=Actinomadura vinacea TaxID=115336 RepID=A0ABP5X5H7_9ACTN